MPRLAWQVHEPVVRGDSGHGLEHGRVSAADDSAVVCEVDGQPELVLRESGSGGGWTALGRRHLVDRVFRGAAMLASQFDLPGVVSISATAKDESLGFHCDQKPFELFDDHNIDNYPPNGRQLNRCVGRHGDPLCSPLSCGSDSGQAIHFSGDSVCQFGALILERFEFGDEINPAVFDRLERVALAGNSSVEIVLPFKCVVAQFFEFVDVTVRFFT